MLYLVGMPNYPLFTHIVDVKKDCTRLKKFWKGCQPSFQEISSNINEEYNNKIGLGIFPSQ